MHVFSVTGSRHSAKEGRQEKVYYRDHAVEGRDKAQYAERSIIPVARHDSSDYRHCQPRCNSKTNAIKYQQLYENMKVGQIPSVIPIAVKKQSHFPHKTDY